MTIALAPKKPGSTKKVAPKPEAPKEEASENE